ncbi:MAG: MgtC/SapB family protein [Gammaproteobacteria bacterium]|uniref:MgtC/SapB family protein n=1 Tax=Rhodoferax sp. TaxID=50421 RepID=UPI0017D5B715|nr:MgtC/SapB family protein [Rhodoferax sp.]MBU3899065.1 MgtC/SapB family protein [Gammaproteobacteria bacterium]MBA3057635.1 MgtC/SapB family protein [Rhodoferax sp.]MBU3997625.1 MgtC/SapB family protein [Gammaproteobacteria bacterium]MBU4018509.1 MgtC/SapB family protein [Gammaproteobacteria bacterium]MBU4080521.1 MgtC/SapB family protein [Gammaproteobacteria bacterium]
MENYHLALRFAVAIGLGMLLGLERERSKVEDGGAGVRTFALIALSGALAGHLGQNLGLDWLALALFVAIAALIVGMYVVTAQRGDTGITTEVSALLAFLLGLLCARGQLQLASWIAVAMALLLALKDWLHQLAKHINTTDVEATLKFCIVTLIILPLVPDINYGPAPMDVINPYKIWLMVVLISALNFSSYLLIKIVGPEHGVGLAGLLGGLASSTAVTLGFAQRSRQTNADASALALGIVLAWTVMFFRVALMTALISWQLGRQIAWAMGLLCVAGLGASYWLWQRNKKRERGQIEPGNNPFELDEAIKFGLLFGVVLLLARAAQVYLGDMGLYIAAAVAGLSDVDAITLAMADLVRSDASNLQVAARAIVIAVMANTLTKSVMAIGLGSAELRRITLPIAIALLATGAIGALLL